MIVSAAARLFRRNPGSSLMSIVTLGVGLASVSIAFAVVDAVLLRPLPFAHSDRIVTVSQRILILGSSPSVNTAEEFLTWKKTGLFESAAILDSDEGTLSLNGKSERIYGASVTPEFFDVFGLKPLLGRGLWPEDATAQHEGVIVLGHQLWARRFARDRNIIGRKLLLGDKPLTVVGVMPPEFDFPRLADLAGLMSWAPEQADYWTPLVIDPKILAEGNFNYYMLGRLRPGVDRARVAAEMRAAAVHLFQQSELKYPEYRALIEQMLPALTVYITPLRESMASPVHDALWMVLAVVVLLLVLVLFNLGALLLTKNVEREQEYAVRQALGASRWSLFRQSIVEEAVLAGLASGFALILIAWGLAVVRVAGENKIPRLYDLRIDGPVLGLLLGAAMLSAMLFASLSQLVLGTRFLNISLHARSRSSTGNRRTAVVRSAFLVGELAVSFFLLVGAGLLLDSFRNAMHVNPGFKPEHVLTLKVFFKPQKPEQRLQHVDQLLEAFRAVPGVESASLISRLPLSGDNEIHSVKAAGGAFARSAEAITAEYRVIDSAYFRTMQIPLLAGRELQPNDSAALAVVNERMAQRLWPGKDAVGKLFIDGDNPPLTVVGVVGNVHNGALEKPELMQFYRLLKANPFYSSSFVLRTAMQPSSLIPRLRKVVEQSDPAEPIATPRTMDQLLSAVTLQRRFATGLLTGLGSMALFLTAVGLFSVVSVSVAQRTREFGIRLALGATASQIVALELTRIAGIVVFGLSVGVVSALACARLIEGQLFGVSSRDANVYLSALAIVLLSATVAALIPAWRSGHLDPAHALRRE